MDDSPFFFIWMEEKMKRQISFFFFEWGEMIKSNLLWCDIKLKLSKFDLSFPPPGARNLSSLEGWIYFSFFKKVDMI